MSKEPRKKPEAGLGDKSGFCLCRQIPAIIIYAMSDPRMENRPLAIGTDTAPRGIKVGRTAR